MPSRDELNARAIANSLDPTGYENDSVLEQAVIFAENNTVDTAGVVATGTITSTGTAPSNNDTVTIGSVTYTFKTTLTASTTANEVLIGASAATALDNLKSAINASAGGGTTYGSETVAHPTVNATTNTDTTQVVVSDIASVQGNNIATTESAAELSWGAATLASGADVIYTVDERSRAAVSGGADIADDATEDRLA